MSMTGTALAGFDETRLFGPDVGRSAEMDAVWAWTLAQDAGVPNWLTLPPAAARALQDGLARRWNAILPAVAQVEALTIPGHPAIPAQLIEPEGARPGCILFLHGGGWSFGSLETYGRFMRLLAVATRCRVLGIAYRLAPEHPYPAPLDDARAAWRWLVTHRTIRAGFDGPLAIAGDSAGANLAMGVMLDAIGTGQALPDCGLLFYGAYAAGTASRSYARFAEGFGLTRAGMARFWDFYAPPSVDRGDPLISPLEAPEADLGRLPRLFVNAAGLDPLLSDSLAMLERLRRGGVDHAFLLHDRVHHGFMQMSLRLPEAQRAIDAAGRFFRTSENKR